MLPDMWILLMGIGTIYFSIELRSYYGGRK